MLYLALIVCALFLAQPAFADSRDRGTLQVQIKDHRDAIGDFSTLELVLEAILVSPKSGLKFWQTSWKQLTPSVERMDLTRYSANHALTVFKSELAEGAFDAIHLRLKEISGILKKNNSTGEIKNLLGPIKLGFSVRPGETTLIILDLIVIDMSDHPPRGYELELNGYELYANGKLVEKIPPA